MAGTMMQRAMRHLKRKLDATVGRQVTIIAGTESLEQIEAVPVTANFQDFTSDEYAVSAQQFDWIVNAADLVFPLGGKLEPADGWQIKVVLDDGRTATYVVRPGGSSRCFEVEDQLGILLNVHTKLERVE